MENQAPKTENAVPSPLVGSFEKGKTAAFQCFLLQQLVQAQDSFENQTPSNNASETLTKKISNALFKKLSSQILSTEFAGWVRKTSAEAAIEHLHETVGVA